MAPLQVEKHAPTAGGRAIFAAELGYIYGRSGRSDEALSRRATQNFRCSHQPIPAYEIAWYAGLGEKLAFGGWTGPRPNDPFLITFRQEFRAVCATTQSSSRCWK
jgi:hypothetical protein